MQGQGAQSEKCTGLTSTCPFCPWGFHNPDQAGIDIGGSFLFCRFRAVRILSKVTQSTQKSTQKGTQHSLAVSTQEDLDTSTAQIFSLFAFQSAFTTCDVLCI